MLFTRGATNLTTKEQFDVEAAVRGSLIQLMGGAVLIAGLYYTALGFRLTREGHLTDRYARAIELLGNQNLDIRIGGIYALERIMLDSPPDRSTIIEVLTTFIREHSRFGPRLPSENAIGADVQAAIDIIGRRPNPNLDGRLDFYHSGLNQADLSDAHFGNAMFYYCHLNEASFSSSTLDGAGLSFCIASGAAFTNCSARGAHFVNAVYRNGWFLNADLTNADFYGTDLSGSDFGRRYEVEGNPPISPAILTGARFTKAKLVGTNLRGVNLRTVRGLTEEQLRAAIIDENTKLPNEWNADPDD